MSGLPYQGGMNSYMFDVSQYGVNQPSPTSALQGLSGLASLIPVAGPIIGAGLNFAGMAMQNAQQEKFFNEYMSPQARMQQMAAAGINPNAAAQGISGSSAPQMNAAAPTSAFSSLGEQLGNSVNNALTADAIKAGIAKTNAETDLTNSLNVEKQTTNKYLDSMQQANLKSAINAGVISEHMANMYAVDDYYKGAEAGLHYQQSIQQLANMAKQYEVYEADIYRTYAQGYAEMMAGNLSEAQIHKVFSDIGLNNAQINRIAHEVEAIDASVMSTYQGMTESRARTWLLRTQADYQQKINDEWTSTGWNRNSDVNTNIQGALMRGDYEQAEKMMQGLTYYIYGAGNARFHSKDYMMDNAMEIIGDVTRLIGAGMIGTGLGSQKSPTNLIDPSSPQGQRILDKINPNSNGGVLLR